MTLRIVHIITRGAPMGAQIGTLDLVRHQQALPWVCVIIGSDGPFGRACRGLGVATTVIRMRNRLLDPLVDRHALIQRVRELRRMRPHILHTHTSKAGILGRWAAFLAGVPVIVHTVHIPPQHAGQRRAVQGLVGAVEAPRSGSKLQGEIHGTPDSGRPATWSLSSDKGITNGKHARCENEAQD